MGVGSKAECRGDEGALSQLCRPLCCLLGRLRWLLGGVRKVLNAVVYEAVYQRKIRSDDDSKAGTLPDRSRIRLPS